MKHYSVIDHTADLGIRFYGKTIEDLFAGAGTALFDLMIQKRSGKPGMQQTVNVSGIDWADLLVNWLRELLYLWIDGKMIVTGIRSIAVKEFSITAQIDMSLFVENLDEVKHEIKAVTYHQAAVTQLSGKWEAVVIFDV